MWLRDLAVANGYGHIMDVRMISIEEGDNQAEAAAKYLSKMTGYVSKSASARGQVPWLQRDGKAAQRGGYAAWTSSQNWGSKMKAVRESNAKLGAEMAERKRAALALVKKRGSYPTSATDDLPEYEVDGISRTLTVISGRIVLVWAWDWTCGDLSGSEELVCELNCVPWSQKYGKAVEFSEVV